jgi:hypothetical protein
LPERPEGCFAQNGPLPFSRALAGYSNKPDHRPEFTKGHLGQYTYSYRRIELEHTPAVLDFHVIEFRELVVIVIRNECLEPIHQAI